ncbi:MAG: nuclear transport factor 2 family protein, partial [Myxococcota bacterium]
RMNHSVDAQTWDQYVSFYTEDGVLDSGIGGVAEGRQGIRELLEMMAPYISTKRHVASNIVINGEGDSATAVSYLTIFEREEALRIDGTAVITDEFERQPDGTWLVVRHTTVVDPATAAANNPGGAE